MRKKYVVVLCTMICFALSGCSANKQVSGEHEKSKNALKAEMKADADKTVDISKIKNICELATLKCTYNNLAKATKEAGEGLIHFGEKERKFWIEYKADVEISYNSELIQMEQDGTNIRISLPEPKVECTIDPTSWNENSYIIAKDQWIQKNPITADDQKNAVAESKKELENRVKENASLMETAESQAKQLIENYINQVGDVIDVKYNITWDEKSKSSETSEDTTEIEEQG